MKTFTKVQAISFLTFDIHTYLPYVK